MTIAESQTSFDASFPPDPNSKPHILLDARFAKRQCGGDRCRYELAKHLLDAGEWPLTVLGYDHASDMLGISTEKALVMPCMPDQHPKAELFEHLQMPLLARRKHIDIYHATFNVLSLLAPAPVTLLTIHDVAAFAFPEAFSRRFAIYGRQIIRAGMRKATHLVAITEATRQEMLRFCPEVEGKITVILNGVGQEFLNVVEVEPAKVRQTCKRLGLITPYILFVGNQEPKKNLVRLVQAFQKMRARMGVPHRLVIVGKQPESGPSSGLGASESYEAVDFTGFVEDSDLPLLYRGADLVAYPSLYEGFGMPVLEGMAAGVPVLTSSVSSLPEVAGGAALLVNPVDTDAIAQGLYQALTDQDWRRFAMHEGRKRALSLTWAENACRTTSLYHRLWEQHLRSGTLYTT